MREKIEWLNERRKVSELKPFEGNPRKANEKEVEDLQKSLEKFNVADPLVINTDGTVIGGNFRLSQLKQRGIEEVDVRVPSRELTDDEARELNLRLNKNTAQWDTDLLANFSEDMLKDVGFGEDELDNIFGLEETEEFNLQKELEKTTKGKLRGVKMGDIWQLGNHKLIIGDATDEENWKKLLGDERFDFMCTYPPYKLAYSNKRVRKVKTKEGWKLKRERTYESVGETTREGEVVDDKPKQGFGYKGNRIYEGVEMHRGVPEFDEWLSIANKYQNPKGANVMIYEHWSNTPELWRAIEKYWKIRNMIIWHLPNRHQGFSAKGRFFNKYDIAPLAGNGVDNREDEPELMQYLEDEGQKLLDTYEICLYAQKGESEFSKAKGTKYWVVTDHVTWTASTESNSGQSVIFGTKPLQVIVPYIKVLSPRDGIIVEPFAGSGTTIIASEIMKRRCRAIELSPTYAEVILTRWEKFSKQEPVRIYSEQ
jgi:DNA modification methylase